MGNSKTDNKSAKNSKPIQKDRPQSDEKKSAAKNKVRTASKQAILISLLERPDGASIDEMARATGWQGHSVRGVISGVIKKKLGRSVTSEKEERGRRYRISTI